MAAAALSKMIEDRFCEIHVVESSEIGIVGVGEATIPPILTLNRLLGIDEDEFIRKTHGTFKLAIQFVDWMGDGTRYYHPFGMFGFGMGPLPMPHYWRRLRTERGPEAAGELDDYSLTASASTANRFQRRHPILPGGANVAYAYHFDASLYARFLREQAESRGVVRHDRKIVGHKLAERHALALRGRSGSSPDLTVPASSAPLTPGTDPELRFTPHGTPVATFRVASGRQWKDVNSTLHEETEWFRVVAWDKLGEICNQYLPQGTRVYVEGRLRTNKLSR